jgi:RHS repeat-associated protein
MRTRNALLRAVATIVLAALFLSIALAALNAQTTPDNTIGLTPYQSFHGGDIDVVNLSNGNLILNIPIIAYPQRGTLKMSFSLVYNSRNIHSTQQCFNFPPAPPRCVLFWIYGSGPSVVNEGQVSIMEQIFQSPNQGPKLAEFAVTTPDGGQHPLALNFPNTGQNATDGSGFWANSSSVTTAPAPTVIIDRDGVRHFISPSAPGVVSEDPNGNTISIRADGAITDTMGRVFLSGGGGATPGSPTSNFSGCTGPLPIASATIWSLPGISGGTTQYKFCQVTVTVSIPAHGTVPASGGNSTLLQSIVLPNGTAWTFEYSDRDPTDPATVNYGTLTKITLPTGGTSSYTYTLGVGSPCANYTSFARLVTSRTVNANDGSGPHIWQYNLTTTTVTDPLGNDTVHSFPAFGLPTCTRFETKVQIYQGSSSSRTLLKTAQTDYLEYASGNDVFKSDGIAPIRVTTTWPNGQVTKVETDYDSNAPGGIPYGNVIAKREYDYANGAFGPLLRQTKTAYMAFTGPNSSSYLANNMLSLTYTTQTLNGSGAQVAFTTNAYDQSSLTSSGVSTQHDSAPPTGTYRGNLTSVSRWLNSGTLTCPSGGSAGSNSNVVRNASYFDTGLVKISLDPCSNSTSYAYSSTYVGALPTTVTNPLNQASNFAYDLNTGLLTSSTDTNNLITSYTYDNMWRLASVTAPDGGVTSITHQESSVPFTATLAKPINSSPQNVTTTNVFDGAGRLSQSQLTSDQQGTTYTDTTYDALGRVSTVSNPHRSGTDITTTSGTTIYGYDPLGRKTSETYPDSSVLTSVYCGTSTLVTDPTSRWRRSRLDGLGRLVEVDEPNSTTATVASTGCPGTGEPIWVTSYGFDSLGNMLSVLQNGSHSRTFTYDSFSRLLTSANPEVGTITYTYNPDGPVLNKKDARNITTTYLYDAIHRETSRSYSNSDSTITTVYDGSNCLGLTACQNIGRRTGMTDAAGSEIWSYEVDQTNHRTIHKDQRTTNSSPSNITKTATYYLDLGGNVTQAIYPTTRTVNYTFDSADRPSTAADGSNGITYATGFTTSPGGGCLSNVTCYSPQGTFYALSIGQSSSLPNGLNLTHIYNNRLQPLEFKASSTGGTAIDVTYSFIDPAKNHNAGHVFSITNNLTPSRTQNFTYDQLNRIKTAGTTATTGAFCWGYDYSSSYDPWGNLQSQPGASAYNGCTEYLPPVMTADGNNHLSGFSYDASGNSIGDGVNSYTWNAESQLKVTAGSTYIYDGDGRGVAKANTAVPPVPYKLYWYGDGGEVLAETDAFGATTAEYIFFGGKRVAMLPASGTPIYYLEDLLGTSRVTTTNSGVVCYDADFYPFGGERPYTNTCPQNYKFESKERDTETGNDDFGARYYSNRFGRWLSADWSSIPAPVPYASLSNPQTLNLYSMVADDPESFADLDGHASVDCGSAPACTAEGQQLKPGECGSAAGGGGACRASTDPDQTVNLVKNIPYIGGVLNWLVSGDDVARASRDVRDAETLQGKVGEGTALALIILINIAPGAEEAGKASKAVNLPAWKTIAIDLEHILSGHTEGGTRAVQSGLKDLFPKDWSAKQIENAIREAYRHASKAGASQGDRVLLKGKGSGLNIKMWVNTVTKVIESAWPK